MVRHMDVEVIVSLHSQIPRNRGHTPYRGHSGRHWGWSGDRRGGWTCTRDLIGVLEWMRQGR